MLVDPVTVDVGVASFDAVDVVFDDSVVTLVALVVGIESLFCASNNSTLE